MRVILTEEQYQILEAIINEVAKSFSNKIEGGGSIELVTKDAANKYKITNVFGHGKYIEVKDSYGSYIFDLSGSLNQSANTFTALKGGRYKAAQVSPNGKILSPEQIIGGSSITVSNVKKVDIYDPYDELVDTAYTFMGDEEIGKGEDREKEVRKDIERAKSAEQRKKDSDERIRDLVLNDPQLQRAISHQPTLFKGLLNFGRRKGIGPAKERIEKYLNQLNNKEKETEKDSTSDFKDFKVNSNLRFEILNKPIILSYGGQRLSLGVGETYAARYVGKQYLKGKGFKIYLKEKEGENIYSGTIKAFFKEAGADGGVEKIIDKMDNVIIKIKDYNY